MVTWFRWFESSLSRGWTWTSRIVYILILIIKWPVEIKSSSRQRRFAILCLRAESIENPLLVLLKTKRRLGLCQNIGTGHGGSIEDLYGFDLALMNFNWHLLHRINGLSDPSELESDISSTYTGFENKVGGWFGDEKSIFKHDREFYFGTWYIRMNSSFLFFFLISQKIGIYHFYQCRKENIGINQHLCFLWEFQFAIVDPSLDGITKHDTIIHCVLIWVIIFAVSLDGITKHDTSIRTFKSSTLGMSCLAEA